MQENNNKVTFAGNPITVVGNEVAVGEKAPDFTVLDGGLQPTKLSDYAGKTRVIAVYPSIDTSVCAAQNRKFNAVANEMEDVVVLSISCDLPFAQKRFCAAEGLENIVTLSDHKDTDFGLKYGFLIKELRLLSRGTVIVDKNDTIQYVEWVPEVTEEPDYDKAMDIIKSL